MAKRVPPTHNRHHDQQQQQHAYTHAFTDESPLSPKTAESRLLPAAPCLSDIPKPNKQLFRTIHFKFHNIFETSLRGDWTAAHTVILLFLGISLLTLDTLNQCNMKHFCKKRIFMEKDDLCCRYYASHHEPETRVDENHKTIHKLSFKYYLDPFFIYPVVVVVNITFLSSSLAVPPHPAPPRQALHKCSRWTRLIS